MPNVTRRNALTAVPEVAEENGDRLSRLMREISEILDDALMGTFTAVIGPSKDDRPLIVLMPTSDVRKAFALLRGGEDA